MKLYIVTETSRESNILMRSWVCFTEDQAKECLKKRYEIACTFNSVGGEEKPIDCLEYGFFFWENQNLKYQIEKTETFAE